MNIYEFQNKYLKFILMFEKETGKHAIYRNKITKNFKQWLRQKIKYKDLKCKDPNCPKFGQEFPSKRSLANHIKWHKPGYRENKSKLTKKQWQNEEFRERMTGENAPMYGKHHSEETKKKIGDKHRGKIISNEHKRRISEKLSSEKCHMYGKFGEECVNWKGDNVGYKQIHSRAHEADPKPKDGICELCGKVADKKGISKLVHSNKDHTYKMPINPNDWQWIHHSCHRKYDSEKRMENNQINEC